MSYVDDVIADVKKKNANEPEFIQAVTEVLESLRVVVDNEPKYREHAILELSEHRTGAVRNELGAVLGKMVAVGAVPSPLAVVITTTFLCRGA